MSPEEILARITELDLDTSRRGSAELDRILLELNDLASAVHQLDPGDVAATRATIDELRRRYTAWFNVAVAREAGQVAPPESINPADPVPDNS